MARAKPGEKLSARGDELLLVARLFEERGQVRDIQHPRAPGLIVPGRAL